MPGNQPGRFDPLGGSVAVRAMRTTAAWAAASATARTLAWLVRAVLGQDWPGAEARRRAAGPAAYGPDVAGGSLVVAAASRAMRPAQRWLAACARLALSAAEGSATVRGLRRLARTLDDIATSGPCSTSLAIQAARGLARLVAAEPAGAALAFILFALPFVPTTVPAMICTALGAVHVLRLAYLATGARPRESRLTASRPVAVRRRPCDIPAALFALALLASAITSQSHAASAPAVVLWAAYFATYVAALSSPVSPRAVKFVAAALLLSASLVSAIGIVQFFRGAETSASWIDRTVFEDVRTRVYSVFDNPNMLAEFLGFALPLGVALILANPRSPAMLFYLPAVCLSAVCLALTYSRGGWVAALMGVAAVVIARSRRAAVAFLVLIVVTAPLLPSSIRTRAITALTMQDSSTRYRLTIWKSAVRMIRDYWPSGVGLGAGAFAYVYPAYEIAGTPAAHTHNLYLQLLTEVGVPGLVSFAWLLLGFASEVATAGRTQEPLLFAGLAGSIAGQAVHGIIDNIWYSPKNVFAFWAVLGLALAVARNGRSGGDRGT